MFIQSSLMQSILVITWTETVYSLNVVWVISGVNLQSMVLKFCNCLVRIFEMSPSFSKDNVTIFRTKKFICVKKRISALKPFQSTFIHKSFAFVLKLKMHQLIFLAPCIVRFDEL